MTQRENIYLVALKDIVARLLRPYVDGVEVTQAIQHYRSDQHLTDAVDQGPDNSLRLVASKPAWVRVYVRSGLVGGPRTVTGTLSVERRRELVVWDQVTTISPQPPGSVNSQSTIAYTQERGVLGNTLNFVIPANQFWGNLRLTVRLLDAAGTSELASEELLVDATLLQTLRLRGILVSYNGPSTANVVPGAPPSPTINLAAPTIANLQASAAFALRVMPVQSTGSFASAGTLAWSSPLDDPRSGAGQCSTNWNGLLTALGNQRTADGNRGDVVYYGLLPAGIPINVPGCGQGGLGGGRVGDQGTLLHEIGHGYGFQHTPCGAAGATDPNYPTYRPYASASIGEYGLDISNGNILTPRGTFDYMSYCFPQWISPYQHGRLIGHIRLAPSWLRDEPFWKQYVLWRPYLPWRDLPDPPPEPWPIEMNPDPIIAISGIVHGPGEIGVVTVARVSALGEPPGRATTLTARLTDADGGTLASARVFRFDSHGGCGCSGEEADSPSYAFQAYVPDVEAGAALAIEDGGGNEVWSRKAPARAPEVAKTSIDVGADGALQVRWNATTATDDREAWLQWSADEGKTWRGLITGVHEDEVSLPSTGLPAGPILVRVLVHDGFLTVASEPMSVTLPERPPEVAILHPSDGQTVSAGATLHLWAAITDGAGDSIDAAEALWLLGDQEIARGAEAWVVSPGPGEHKLTLVVQGPGGRARESLSFQSISPRHRRHERH